MVKFALVWNNATGYGYVCPVEMSDIWSNSNPNGWTYQDLTGSFGHVQGLYETEEDAKKDLKILKGTKKMKKIKDTYYSVHPSHSHLKEAWSKDTDGTVWLTVHDACDKELFFNAKGELVEIEWIYSEVYQTTIGSICINGKLSFDGLKELSNLQNQCLHTLGYDTTQELASDIRAAYRLECNPLPTLRKSLKELPIDVVFSTGQGHFDCNPGKGLLIVEQSEDAVTTVYFNDLSWNGEKWEVIKG